VQEPGVTRTWIHVENKPQLSKNTFGSLHYYLIPLSGLESKTLSFYERFVGA
jgi:hypothetical protein